MDTIIWAIIILSIGSIFWAVSIYLQVKNKNQKTIYDELTLEEQKENSVMNTNFTHFMSVLSFGIGTLVNIVAIIIAFNPGERKFEDILPQSETITSEAVETSVQYAETITEELVSSKKDNNTEQTTEEQIVESDIIKGDCTLKDTFSEYSSKKRYILYSQYNGTYGVTFKINNVKLSYNVRIIDDKGNICYEYSISSDGETEVMQLEKNMKYDIIVEVNDGYPQYEIILQYPDNDDY